MRAQRWQLGLLALLGVGLTGALGLWQLGRAQQKLDQQAAQQRAERLPVLRNAELAHTPSLEGGRRLAVLRGRWLPERQIWLDNRAHDRRNGTLLLTPLALEGRQEVIWVQRGWQERSPGLHAVPPWPATPAGVLEVQGLLRPQASQVKAFGAESAGPLRQNLDLSASAAQLGRPVLPWVLWQTGPACAPLRCDWPAPDSGVHKHWGYAAQWFALAALILGLYVWFQFLKPARTGE